MRNVPPDIGETQPIIRIVEVLPAPLGPRKPNDSPRATSKSMASTAVNSPNRLVSPRAWMSGVVSGSVDGARELDTAVDKGVSGMGGHGTPAVFGRLRPETGYVGVANGCIIG